MMEKIILIVSLLQICTGADPLNSQSHSNQAISSQSFVRHDVPLSYKYSAVHTYTTPRPEQYEKQAFNPQHHQQKSHLPKEIQYAPIYNEQTEQMSRHGIYPTQDTADKVPENLNAISEKTHLEPKVQDLHNTLQGHLAYVPGYNVELLQAVNRYPGHNAVYRSYPNMSPTDKINKVNFLNQYVLYQKSGEDYQTSVANHPTPKELKLTKATLSTFEPKQQLPVGQKHKQNYAPHLLTTIRPVTPLLNIHEVIPHPKAHRMLLNIARTYNIAENPNKAQHASLTLLKNVPSHTQAIIHIPNPADIERNTILLPIESKQLSQFEHRMS